MPIKKIYSSFQETEELSLYLKKIEEPISSCKIFKEKKMAMIGISMGNSYFSEDRLRFILSGFCSNFENVAVLLVDDLAIHNYRAMGYTEKKAKKKIRVNSNHTSNRIKKVIKGIEEKNCKKNIRFCQWGEVEEFTQYQQSVKLITEYYYNDNDFSSEINQATLKVMNEYISDTQTEGNVIEEAKWYLLKELAFIHCASEFFKSTLLTCYYTDFPLLRNILENDFMGIRDDHTMAIYECIQS